MTSQFRHFSTLPLLCLFMFTSLTMNVDALFIGAGGFKLSPFDYCFVLILLAKGLRIADPAGYTLPPPRVAILMAVMLLSFGYLLCVAPPSPEVELSDVFRDLRIVFYFLLTPYLCYKDIDGPEAYRKLQLAIVWTGIAVSLIMVGEVAYGFGALDPVRDVRLGIWVLPLSLVSLIYFREELGIKQRTAYAMGTFMLVALVFSLNRSQYLQCGISVVLAVMMGGRVGALRKAVKLFVPTLIAGMLVLASIGYITVLADRLLTVEDLDNDSSYGARVQEYEGQMDLFHIKPLMGHGPGYRSWVMGENGFELSTFAHNSWAFYLMKFGIIGTFMIMFPCLLLMICTLGKKYVNPELELHRRYLIACAPAYIFIDSMSGGLAYAPKTAFTGFLLTYCLSLLRNDGRATATDRAVNYGPVVLPAARSTVSIPVPKPLSLPGMARKSTLPRLPYHG
jgi:O-antigen ligase